MSKRTSLSMPAHLIASLRERARAEGISHEELLLDALSAAQEDLPGLLEEEKPLTDDGLFLRRTRRANVVGQDTVAVFSVRLLTRNLDVMDELVEQVGARSRSALCVAALRAHLER